MKTVQFEDLKLVKYDITNGYLYACSPTLVLPEEEEITETTTPTGKLTSRPKPRTV